MPFECRVHPTIEHGQLARVQTDEMRRQFAQQSASSEAQGYAVAARADAKVTVNPQALD